MPSRHLRLLVDAEQIRVALDAVRAELKVPGEFPADVRAEAEQAAAAVELPELDLTEVPFVTIDPPTSMDLDQALHLQRDGDGFHVQYAIADVAAFVRPGGAVDLEAHQRGETFYGPDHRASLHPTELSEGAASLLPDQERAALVWDLRLDAQGELTDAALRRARVRSRAKLNYDDVQRDLDAGTAGEMLDLLPVIGELRLERERARGGVSLPIPEQDVVSDDGGYRLEFRSPLPVEGWNAQLSLLAGMAAADMMREARIGILRTLPEAAEHDVKRLRRTARALNVDWPDDLPYAGLIPTLDATTPSHAAFLNAATVVFRGAGYAAFDGEVPGDARHAAIADEYAHVTAPLRRLVDRYGLEICAAVTAGTEVPQWVREALPALPDLMNDSGRRAGAYEAACVNLVEAAVMTGREGTPFDGVIVEVDRKDPRGTVVVTEPAVQGRIDGDALPLGEAVSVVLREASIERRTIAFALAGPAGAGSANAVSPATPEPDRPTSPR